MRQTSQVATAVDNACHVNPVVNDAIEDHIITDTEAAASGHAEAGSLFAHIRLFRQQLAFSPDRVNPTRGSLGLVSRDKGCDIDQIILRGRRIDDSHHQSTESFCLATSHIFSSARR